MRQMTQNAQDSTRRTVFTRTSVGLMGAAGLLVAGGLLGGFATRDAGSSHAESVGAGALVATHAENAVSYSVDAVHSHVVFYTMHMGAGRAYGMFHAPTGSLTFDPGAKTLSDMSVRVDVSKVDTGHNGRDDHLRGGDFFSASEFPAIVFSSKEVADLSDGSDTVDGTIEMLGKSVPVEVAITMVGTGSNPRSGKDLAGFVAEFTIKRSDFGMNYGIAQGALGDEVHLTVAIEAAN